ncbi:MAG: hypothetical protein IT430_00780 [Phycisphaerales bacterium]|nr:hypothetical protein [Phycisphaerales bacterium]
MRRRQLACFIGIVAQLLAISAVQAQSSEAPWPFISMNQTLREAKPQAPLIALLDLRQGEQRAIDEGKWASLLFDLEATAATLAGDYTKALEAEARFYEHQPPHTGGEVDLSAYHAVPAISTVLEMSRQRRVVMLNEEHRVSLQRAFLAETIEDFHRLGFTHLAMETLTSKDPAIIKAQGCALTSTGFYTKDPVLAEAVRRALAAGMEVVSYEPDSATIGPEPGDRDRRSGESLAKLLHDDPEARVLVYAGRYHIAETGDAQWKPMAAILRERTGIDPLTVDLSLMRECQRRADEHSAYRAAERLQLLGNEPVVLANGEGEFYTSMPGQIDVQVFFPRTSFIHGRPDWLDLGGRRAVVDLEPLAPESSEPLFVRADRVGAPPDAVAADQAILWPDDPTPALLLAPGEYSIRFFTRNGPIGSEVRQVVAAPGPEKAESPAR